MATKSGKDGNVLVGGTPLASVVGWRLRTVSHNPAHASSATGGAKTRNPGVKDATGLIRFKLDFADPATEVFEEGDEVTLQLYLDSSRFYSVPAIIDVLELDEIDIDEGQTIGGLALFSGTGPITKPTFG